jgi:ABC-type multidrug transport system ATPase subunit
MTGPNGDHGAPGVVLDDAADVVLDIRRLAFAYPDGRQALYGVDLTVRRGERVAVLGPNGAGKTTLIVTHDLPYALQLCPRAVVMNHGVIVADGPTPAILADADLMAANRLELPYGCVVSR